MFLLIHHLAEAEETVVQLQYSGVCWSSRGSTTGIKAESQNMVFTRTNKKQDTSKKKTVTNTKVHGNAVTVG